MRGPHKLLGVPEGASEEEIRRSYRKLVRRHHPDLNPEDPKAEERFKELQRAYESLMNSRKRKDYDRTSRQRPSKPRSKTARGPADLSSFLRRFGYQSKGRAAGEAGRLRELSEEDISRILKRFGIDTAQSSRIRVSFGDAANFERPSSTDKKNRPEKPPINEGLIKPPKPPKPPKW